MQSTNEIVEEAKRKRTLASLKPTSLPESHNTINTTTSEEQNYGNTTLTHNQKNGNTTKPEMHNSVIGLKPEEQKNDGSDKKAPENHNTIKKVKVTVYITEESWDDFNNIYGRRILNKRKTDKGDLMTEAIELLKQKENARIP